MQTKYQIELDATDIAQTLDGVEMRAQAWENTATYLRTGRLPSELFLPEECGDAREAIQIAEHYRWIAGIIRKQMELQGG